LSGNPVTQQRLEAAGATVLTFAGNDLCLKGGGGPTCLTRPIIRSA
jgi:arginine deiminase